MDDTAKYLINATITADGVVERTDVVGAIYGQTEGLLGEDLDLRDLQDASRVGRIDVEIDSEGGRSFGDVTIASSLDRVETAILAAALETITRVGPCQARVEVTTIEDVRAAKRRIVVQRATELLEDSFADGLTSDDIVAAVREAARDTDEVGEYRGVPAGPNVPDSDAVVVVEGRADVAQLLRSGIKNAVAVEGTNVPDAVADLTTERTTTAFLDGDRGGELVLRELAQVGDVDYVAAAPEGRSVEDLSPEAVTAALRAKRPYEVAVADEDWTGGDRADAAGDGGDAPAHPSGYTVGDRSPFPRRTVDVAGEGARPGDDGSERPRGEIEADPDGDTADDADLEPAHESDADAAEAAAGDVDDPVEVVDDQAEVGADGVAFDASAEGADDAAHDPAAGDTATDGPGSDADDAADTPDTDDAADTPDTDDAADTPDTDDAADAPDTDDAADAPDADDAADAPDADDATDASDADDSATTDTDGDSARSTDNDSSTTATDDDSATDDDDSATTATEDP